MWRTEELLSQGLSKRRINENLRSGSLVRVRTGVMVRGTFWHGLSVDGRERAQLAAYCHRTLRVTADGLTFSHTSAARLHRLYLWKADQLIHVIIPYHAASGSHAADVRAHSGLLVPGQRIEIDGLPVTALDCTVLDCAQILNYRQGLILLDASISRQAFDACSHFGLR
jgi:predicted transcriptional regulator of viral defense system